VVVFGDEVEHFVEGKGSVQIKMKGKTWLFMNVFYVPGLEKILLSINWIAKQSPHLDVTFPGDKRFVRDKRNNKTIPTSVEEHGLFTGWGTMKQPKHVP
jgi:hypothetical protein